MSKLCVYFLVAPSAGVLTQAALMWKTHTPTVLVDAAMVLSKRALPDEYRQRHSSSCSQLYPFSPMISVSSFSPHLSLRIPEYASLSLGWSPTHQVPSMSFHDCVFDSSGRACAADVAISRAAIPVKNSLFTSTFRQRPTYQSLLAFITLMRSARFYLSGHARPLKASFQFAAKQ